MTVVLFAGSTGGGLGASTPIAVAAGRLINLVPANP